MGIQIGAGRRQRDWSALAFAAAETIAQGAALGPGGFSGAVSAFFRLAEGLRGEDDVELRATYLVVDSLCYAGASAIAAANLGRAPSKAESQSIIEGLLSRAGAITTQNLVYLEPEHLQSPMGCRVFDDAAQRFPHHVRDHDPRETADDLAARFRTAVTLGVNKVRTRRPDYFAPVIQSLVGPDSTASAQELAWERYRSLLVRRFEDAPLFGEDDINGVTLGQVYQPLRAWWHELMEEPDSIAGDLLAKKEGAPSRTVYLRMLEALTLDWLEDDDAQDRVRLISGGPGSGKSTFARWLAAHLATMPRWRVLFVPLQRLRGRGPLETRIDNYFRLHVDEPFGHDTPPMALVGRDAHRDWLVVFDGLDELAKEGAGAESAAQDFASDLSDMRARFQNAVRMRCLVLGRAPSMQEARRRLGLQGSRTLHVADMVPLDFAADGQRGEVKIVDPGNLATRDQREEYWGRWAVAKGLPLVPPEAMRAEALSDLTKEPLLAFLLIKSGYASDRWQEAADNRNRIYDAIFNQIWERERTKETRTHLNDLGKDGFDGLMQALGIAAWRGGGRTGDEATFNTIRDAFMRPDLLERAKVSHAADLDNIAVLFYTQKDETSGRGYEFLHKSFGEYLTACGLHSAFRRWGRQVEMPEIDFDEMAFLRRWLVLAGPAEMTFDIASFVMNEALLRAVDEDRSKEPWEVGRSWIAVLKRVIDKDLSAGPPAHEDARTLREAEANAHNAEKSLFLVFAACAEVAYPMDLLHGSPELGGWLPGPIRIASLLADRTTFAELVRRLRLDASAFSPHLPSTPDPLRNLSRLNLTAATLIVEVPGLDLRGCNLDRAFIYLRGGAFNLSGASLRQANLSHSMLFHADLSMADLSESQCHGIDFEMANLPGARFDGASLLRSDFRYADLRNASFVGASFDQVDFTMADVSSTDLRNAKFLDTPMENALPPGESLEKARDRRFSPDNPE